MIQLLYIILYKSRIVFFRENNTKIQNKHDLIEKSVEKLAFDNFSHAYAKA